MAGRKGFTAVELLVGIAVMAVLLAIFLPAIARVREVARQTVCASRLRDLTAACNLYRSEFGRYPLLSPERSTSLLPPSLMILLMPDDMSAPFLNNLRRYLNFRAIDPNLIAADLPPMLQCPMVEDSEQDRSTPISLSTPTVGYYTGYSYFGRVDETELGVLSVRIELLKPERAAVTRNPRGDGVLWADDLHWSAMNGGGWSYSHCGKPVRPGPTLLTYEDASGLTGQHRAHADGHVEWVPAASIPLDVSTPLLRDQNASLKIEPLYYSWF